MIIKAIMSTGNGFTKESGIHIIDDLHKFDLISQLGFRHNGQKKLTNNVGEYLGVFENDKNITGLYFNLNRLYEVSAQKLKID